MNSNLQNKMEAELGAKPNKIKTQREIEAEALEDSYLLFLDSISKAWGKKITQAFPKGRW